MSVGDDYVSEIFYQYLETPDAHTSGIKNQSYHRGGPLDRRVEHSSACCSCTVSVETRFGGAALAMHSTKDLIKVFRCWRCRPCRARSYWLSWNTLHRWSAVAVAKHLCIGSTWGTCAHCAGTNQLIRSNGKWRFAHLCEACRTASLLVLPTSCHLCDREIDIVVYLHRIRF